VGVGGGVTEGVRVKEGVLEGEEPGEGVFEPVLLGVLVLESVVVGEGVSFAETVKDDEREAFRVTVGKLLTEGNPEVVREAVEEEETDADAEVKGVIDRAGDAVGRDENVGAKVSVR